MAYYAYGALATDRYPPFTLADVPDYPAHLEVSYPEHLSRGLVLVKWWLLALPHYVVVGIFTGGGLWIANEAASRDDAAWTAGGGLIGLLVLVAAVVLLFTGRYPSGVFDLVLGLNRWVIRVAAYAGLMTDDYPPFRLDTGPDDPGSRVGIRPPAPQPSGDGQPPPDHWSAPRVVMLVLGCLGLLAGTGFLGVAATLGVLQGTLRDDDGFVMSGREELSTASYAIVSESLETQLADGAEVVPDRLLGDTRLTVEPSGAGAVFVGIGPTDEVEAYLAEVAHAVVVDFDSTGSGVEPVYRDVAGAAPLAAPEDAVLWTARASGTGTQDLRWAVEDGDWTVVVMNADATAGVTADVAVGAELPATGWAIGLMAALGGLSVLVGGALTWGALHSRRSVRTR
ncbi:DUF4389 domain-containing protein [Nocardioides sp. S5]|uniref:DUF4389 domain-containing protein n=1 Tax=Nocardioides sp. S5 TaxID=2017486 RepID=UPI001F5D696D|nr:DUF4389 domain-containing protein [Nocardioides sp. S5]